jgi:hypothetical protein
MQLLSHRGFWLKPEEKNTKQANQLSFENNWGIETDIRDYKQQLVIAHDMATNADYTFEYLLQQYNNTNCKQTLALNIKADGLSNVILEAMRRHSINNYFVFDMSIAETVRYLKLDMPVYISYSEWNAPNDMLYAKCKGIWLDIFNSVWFSKNFVDLHLKNGKNIAFVSPELHGRNEMELWKFIKENNWHKNNQVMLCTDLPHNAKTYFELE